MAIKVWGEMKGKGVLPGMHMFSSLITALCDENRLDEACEYFNEMLDVGIKAPGHMFSRLKEALLDDGRKEKVVELAVKMDRLRKTQLLG